MELLLCHELNHQYFETMQQNQIGKSIINLINFTILDKHSNNFESSTKLYGNYIALYN